MSGANRQPRAGSLTPSRASVAVGPPAWRCRECAYVHASEAPPAFCPRCAALRARFFRDDGGDEGSAGSESAATENVVAER